MNLKKFFSKISKSEQGLGLPIAIGFVALVVAAGLFVPSFIEQNKGMARKFNDDFKMEVLALSSLEIGKYLLFYEKAFYLDNALDQPIVAGKNIFDPMVPGNKLWSDVCGDPAFSTESKMQHDGRNTFCPLKLRDPFIGGDHIESFLFDFTDTVSEKFEYDPESKSYHLGPVFLSTKGGTPECGESVPDVEGSKNFMFNLRVEPKLKCYIDQDTGIQLDFYFYGKSSSFTSYGSERYVKIVSTVNYRSFKIGQFKTGALVRATAEESLMFSTTTMKDFAVFFAYPSHNASGDWDRDKKTLLDAFNVKNTSVIYGKTFFDGNTNFPFKKIGTEEVVDLSSYPIFNDSLILTGSNIDPIPPTEANIDQIKSKFKKGILSNFGSHLVYDSKDISNQTSGLKRKYLAKDFKLKDVDINVYVTNMVDRTECSFNMNDQPMNDRPRTKVRLSSGVPALSECLTLGEWGGDTMSPLYGGGLEKIISSRDRSTPTFVLAPAAQLEFTKSEANFLGVFVGGKISAPSTAINFYSLLNIDPSKGIPGISDYTDVSIINKESMKAQAGVSVPLRNLVIVLDQ